MTRYYDPVTHWFLNADGYFQSGDGILDTNTNAYCRNNPINCLDPTGTSCHYGGDPKYHPGCHVSPYDGFCNSCGVQDCCWPQDRVIPEKQNPAVIEGVHIPFNGDPGTRYTDSDGNWREYNDNGMPKYDYHDTDHGNPKHHPHGIKNPNGEHMHEWGLKNGKWDDGDPIPWQGDEGSTLNRGNNAIA